MASSSIWIDKETRIQYPQLKGSREYDVLIIGGGISGVTLAQILSENGRRVAILEAGRLAQSNTGRNTGNLYVMVDSLLSELLEKYDHSQLRTLFSTRQKAFDLIEENIKKWNIPCDYQRVDWMRFSLSEQMDDVIEQEYRLFKELGFPAQLVQEHQSIIDRLGGRVGVKIPNQAQFNPYLYVTHLAQHLSKQVDIFEESRVHDLNKNGNYWMIHTQEGSVKAGEVIECTHTPIGFSLLQTLLGPYREHALAGALEEKMTPGIFWGHTKKEEVISLRSYDKDGDLYLLLVGGDHKVGQSDGLEEIEKLKTNALNLGMKKISYQWGGQHYRPADFLPYIGRKDRAGTFVATGFSTNGLIYGTLSAQIISDEILGRTNPYADLFSPTRVTPVKSMKNFVYENVNVLKQYVVDYLTQNHMLPLKAGEGRVVDVKGHKIATCKNQDNELFVCSAVCPHLGCVVHWNQAETSWDCPCHGSRFDYQGHVIEGPSLSSLEKLEGG